MVEKTYYTIDRGIPGRVGRRSLVLKETSNGGLRHLDVISRDTSSSVKHVSKSLDNLQSVATKERPVFKLEKIYFKV